MAASAFTIFDKAKNHVGEGTIDFDTDTFKIAFYRTSAGLSAGIASTYSALGSEISATGGYPTGGEALTVQWTTGASAGQMKFDANDYVLTASGAAINNIRYAVIYEDGTKKLLCYAPLSTAQFTLASGNTLTVAFNASGIFTLA